MGFLKFILGPNGLDLWHFGPYIPINRYKKYPRR